MPLPCQHPQKVSVFPFGCFYQRMVGWIGPQTGKTERVLQRPRANSEGSRDLPEGGEGGSGSLAFLLPDPCVHVFQELPAWADEEACGPPPLLLRVHGLPAGHLPQPHRKYGSHLLCLLSADLMFPVHGSAPPPCPEVLRGPFTLSGSLRPSQRKQVTEG